MKLDELKGLDCTYNELEERIDDIKGKKTLYNTCYKTFKIFIFVAGATLTILAGFKFDGYWKYCLIVSTSITLLTAIESLYNFKSKAMSYDLLLYELRALRNEICYEYIKNTENYLKNRDSHFKKLQEILSAKKMIIEDSFEDTNVKETK